MSFVLVVRMKAKEGEEERAVEIARELAAASRAEPGCEPTSRAATPRIRAGSSSTRRTATRRPSRRTARRSTSSGSRLGELFPLMESRERTFYETL